MATFNQAWPTTLDDYLTQFVPRLQDNYLALSKWFEGDIVSTPVDGMKQYSAANKRLERRAAGNWGQLDLSGQFAAGGSQLGVGRASAYALDVLSAQGLGSKLFRFSVATGADLFGYSNSGGSGITNSDPHTNGSLVFLLGAGAIQFYVGGTLRSMVTPAGLSVDAGNLDIVDANTRLSRGAANTLRIASPTGYVDVGSQNPSFGHIYTDRPFLVTNVGLHVQGLIGVYNGGTPSIRMDGGGMFSDNWFRSSGDTGWFNSTYGVGLIAAPSAAQFGTGFGQYGNVSTYGTAPSGWNGYSINGRVVFMNNSGDSTGIYDDSRERWLIHWDMNSGRTELLCNVWHGSNEDGMQRFFWGLNDRSYFQSPNGFEFRRNSDQAALMIVDNSGNLSAGANITAWSDERLKQNWRDLGAGFVERLAAVRSGVYDRIDAKGLTQVGVSAQSLREVMEHAVIENDSGMLSVSYGNAALAACVELAREVVELRERVSDLEAA